MPSRCRKNTLGPVGDALDGSLNARGGWKQSPRRRGFTLLETILVLALLVAMGAIAWPALDSAFDGQRLRKAADQVRAQWASARLQAMSTGQTYAFRFDPLAGEYTTEAWLGPDFELEASGFEDLSVDVATPRQLPEGIVFVLADAPVDARSTLLAETMPGSMTAAGPMPGGMTAAGPMSVGIAANSAASPAILFFPDGTTSTTRVVLTNQEGLYLPIELRGLTGVAMIGEVLTETELGQ